MTVMLLRSDYHARVFAAGVFESNISAHAKHLYVRISLGEPHAILIADVCYAQLL